MGFASQSTQQQFPFLHDQLFDAVVAVIPAVGMRLRSQDKLIGRITASTGISLFSWGENISLAVTKVDATSSLLSLSSDLKVGLNVGGAHRHAKNFNRIIAAASARLQNHRS